MTNKHKKANIKHYNDKGEPDGYWEIYQKRLTIRWFCGYYSNGERIGCWHWYNGDGKLYKIAYYL